MKQIYIKPETEVVTCNLISMVAESTNSTNWQIGEEGSGGTSTVGDGDDDNPNNAKSINLWDKWE